MGVLIPLLSRLEDACLVAIIHYLKINKLLLLLLICFLHSFSFSLLCSLVWAVALVNIPISRVSSCSLSGVSVWFCSVNPCKLHEEIGLQVAIFSSLRLFSVFNGYFACQNILHLLLLVSPWSCADINSVSWQRNHVVPPNPLVNNDGMFSKN